jgi:hypothetical protein
MSWSRGLLPGLTGKPNASRNALENAAKAQIQSPATW